MKVEKKKKIQAKNNIFLNQYHNQENYKKKGIMGNLQKKSEKDIEGKKLEMIGVLRVLSKENQKYKCNHK